ncbi:serine/threonine-protein kinase [Microbacterium sp. NPDC087665]|uniref:serine/threonine-protein kinase n=1 Tax=Microbacterium sp. NPDC087665 TaxID=3364194 RepID=UPI00381C4677
MSVNVLPEGTTVNDRYVLARKLGSDGEVYQAHDRHLDQTVALKILRPDAGAPQSWDEAKRLEQLRSRYIVPIINADVIGNSDLRYIVTQLLPDGDLESEAAPHGLPSSLAARYGQHIATGLDAVHAMGMLHRDVKPANALLEGDIAVVSDVEFCVVPNVDGFAPRTGSWCTLAPEVAAFDGACTVYSDVYSLAATVYYLLSGEYPVDHRIDRAEQQRRIAGGELRPLSELAPHVPRALAAVVKRGLSFEPQHRHESAEAFGNALATAAGGKRSWRRVAHPGHQFCAEGQALGQRAAVGVCSEPSATGTVLVRAFHLASGRRIATGQRSAVRHGRLSGTIRSVISALS